MHNGGVCWFNNACLIMFEILVIVHWKMKDIKDNFVMVRYQTHHKIHDINASHNSTLK